MRKLQYRIGKMTEAEQDAFDFSDSLSRTVEERIQLGFIPLKLPIVDDAPYRIFDTVAAYRAWAAEKLPVYLGYNLPR